MQSEDRIIHFSTELIHRPSPVEVPALQKLYFDLSQTKHAAYDSTDFTNPVQSRFYSRRGKKSQSLAIFLPDRMLLVEEWADTALSDFLVRLREVASRAMEARQVPVFMAHTATVRSTFALTHFEDAREFLIDHLCAQKGRVGLHFQRPLAVGGLRFVLPETNEAPGELHVTIESFRFSLNEVFVEVKGVFGRQPVKPDALDIVVDNLQRVRDFISGPVYGYLNQFDVIEGEMDP